ncbi:MAG: hypothetical protein V1815_01305 [Candidatus Woesearchaeota archaeon]
MKKWILLLFLLIFIGFVSADTAKVTLELGQSFMFAGKNVTLLRFSDTESKAVLCINNYRYIFEENNPNIIDNLRVEITRIRLKNIDLNIKTIKVSNVECTDACNNDLCGQSEEPVNEEITQPQPGEIPPITTSSTPETQSSTSISDTNVYILIFVIGIIILIIIAFIAVFKRV